MITVSVSHLDKTDEFYFHNFGNARNVFFVSCSNVIIEGDLRSTIDGIDVEDLANSVMSKTKAQTVMDTKIFTSTMTIGRMTKISYCVCLLLLLS